MMFYPRACGSLRVSAQRRMQSTPWAATAMASLLTATFFIPGQIGHLFPVLHGCGNASPAAGKTLVCGACLVLTVCSLGKAVRITLVPLFAS